MQYCHKSQCREQGRPHLRGHGGCEERINDQLVQALPQGVLLVDDACISTWTRH